MPKYLCLQRSLSPQGSALESMSPAQMQEMYEQFGAWQQRVGDQVVDMGGGLGEGRIAHVEDTKDGPFIEVKELVGGYMIVRADDLDAAIAVASSCPGLVRPGSGVEVIEIETLG